MAVVGAVDHVIVRRSAVFTAGDPKSADKLVKAVHDFVRLATRDGFYSRYELPIRAVQAYRADCYWWHASDRGHDFVIEAAGACRRYDWSDVLTALAAMEAEAHLAIAEQMSTYLSQYPNIQSFRAAPESDRREVRRLDKEFAAIEKTRPLRLLSAHWISSWPELTIVEDADYKSAIHRLATMNPLHEIGMAWHSVEKLERQTLDRREVALALACSNAPERGLEIKLLAALRWSVEIDGQPQTVTHVRTNRGLRYGLITDSHVALYERIEVPPFREEERLLDCIREKRDPRAHDAIVGQRLSSVPSEVIDDVISLAKKYYATIAIDMLLRRVGVLGDKVFVFPIGIRPEPSGAIVRWGAVNSSRAVSIETGPNGTSLLNDRSNQILLTVPMREIAEQASRIDALKFKLEQASALL